MEVDQRLGSDLGLDVVLCAGLLHLLGSSIERGNIGVVVLGVVELHDLAADGGLESAIVVCIVWSVQERGARTVKAETHKAGRAEWPCRG